MAPFGTVLWKNMTCFSVVVCAFHSGAAVDIVVASTIDGLPVLKKLAQYSFIDVATASCSSEYLKKPMPMKLS